MATTASITNEQNRSGRVSSRGSAFYVGATLVYYVNVWGQAWLVARTTDPASFGGFAVALSITQTSLALASLNLRTVQITDVNSEFPFGVYLHTRLWLLLSAIVISVLICLIVRGGAGFVSMTIGLSLARASDGISEVFQSGMLRAGRPSLAGRCLMIRGSLAFLVLAVTLRLSSNLVWAVWALAATCWALVPLHDMWLTRRISASVHRVHAGSVSKLIARAFPAGAAAASVTLALNIPIFVMRRFWGDAAVGSFYPLVHVQAAGVVALAALCQAWSPRLAAAYALGRIDEFRSTVQQLVIGALVLGGAGVAATATAGTTLLGFIYGAAYVVRPHVATTFVAGSLIIFVGSVLGFGVTATREFRALWWPYASVAVISGIASLLLIPRFSQFGLALSFVAVSCAVLLAPVVAGYRIVRFHEHFA